MRRIVLTTLLGLAALSTASLGAPETKADFSGTWELDAARSESPHFGESSGPVVIVIKQTDSELTVETTREGRTESLVYKMDGTESERPAPDNGPYKWRVKWDGPKLMTEVHRNINRSTVTVNEIRNLVNGGKEMEVERTLTVQHGYDMRRARNYASAKDVFKKVR